MTDFTATPLRDTFCRGLDPQKDTNFGTSGSLSLGTNYLGGAKVLLDRFLLDFDISGVASQRNFITAAQLELTLGALTGTTAAAWLQRIKRELSPWTEPGATWNKHDGANTWTVDCGDGDTTTPPRIAFNLPSGDLTITGLKDHVLDALDNRAGILALVARLDDESSNPGGGAHQWTGASRDTPNHAPTIRIAYSPPPPPARRPASEPHSEQHRPTAPQRATRPIRPHHPPLGAFA
jgi:hypothetical protein